jgi:hypothetical protein
LCFSVLSMLIGVRRAANLPFHVSGRLMVMCLSGSSGQNRDVVRRTYPVGDTTAAEPATRRVSQRPRHSSCLTAANHSRHRGDNSACWHIYNAAAVIVQPGLSSALPIGGWLLHNHANSSRRNSMNTARHQTAATNQHAAIQQPIERSNTHLNHGRSCTCPGARACRLSAFSPSLCRHTLCSALRTRVGASIASKQCIKHKTEHQVSIKDVCDVQHSKDIMFRVVGFAGM